METIDLYILNSAFQGITSDDVDEESRFQGTITCLSRWILFAQNFCLYVERWEDTICH